MGLTRTGELTPEILRIEVLEDVQAIKILRLRDRRELYVANNETLHKTMLGVMKGKREEVASAGTITYVGRLEEMIGYTRGGSSLDTNEFKFVESDEETAITVMLLGHILTELGEQGVHIFPR